MKRKDRVCADIAAWKLRTGETGVRLNARRSFQEDEHITNERFTGMSKLVSFECIWLLSVDGGGSETRREFKCLLNGLIQMHYRAVNQITIQDHGSSCIRLATANKNRVRLLDSVARELLEIVNYHE